LIEIANIKRYAEMTLHLAGRPLGQTQKLDELTGTATFMPSAMLAIMETLARRI
jgi:hypothetical protein